MNEEKLKEKAYDYMAVKDKERTVAVQILDLIEDLLADYDIVIPNTQRQGDMDEARLYGSDYCEMEDAITDVLKSAKL